MKLKVQKVPFMNNIISVSSLKRDSRKEEFIKQMPQPEKPEIGKKTIIDCTYDEETVTYDDLTS